jgi:hypothetical protein
VAGPVSNLSLAVFSWKAPQPWRLLGVTITVVEDAAFEEENTAPTSQRQRAVNLTGELVVIFIGTIQLGRYFRP